MRPSTHLWDRLIPVLCFVTAGGVVAFFAWKLLAEHRAGGFEGTGNAPKPKEIGPPGRRYRSAAEFLADADEGKDLHVRTRR